MTDEELENYMDAATSKAAEDRHLFACLRHGQRRSLSSMPMYEFGKVLTAVYSLMPPGINDKALENAFWMVLTDMTMWSPDTWKYSPKSRRSCVPHC